jgi:hypothetical protein
MDTLGNVHCLGCKKRHETVNVDAVKTLSVKGSPRYQGIGICPEGKKWTKILNKTERATLTHLIENDFPHPEAPEDSTSYLEKTVAPDSITNSKKDLTVREEEKENEDILSIFEDINDEITIPSQATSESVLNAEEPEVSTSYLEKTVAQDSIIESETDLSTSFDDPEQGLKVQKKVVKGEVINEMEGLRRDLRSVHQPRRPPLEVVDVQEHTNRKGRTYHISAEQAFKYGRHYGYNEASFSGERYKEGISFHFKHSRVQQNFFDDFTRGYIEGGEQYLVNPSDIQVLEDESTSSSISPTTTAGLAAASIFGAWVVSKIKRGG